MTVTSTVTSDETGAMASETSTGIPRRPAAYLTYNTLPVSDGGGAAALDKAEPKTTSDPDGAQSKQTQTGNSVERTPSSTVEEVSRKDLKPTAKPAEPPQAAESRSVEAAAAISVLASIATLMSQESLDSKSHSSQPAEAAAIGVLASLATAVPQKPSAVKSHSTIREAEPQTGAGNPKEISKGALSATPTKPSVPDTISSATRILTLQGQTLTAGNAVMFDGNAVSELPNHDGVIIDQDHTLLLSDGEATTLLPLQDSQDPITISRSGSAFIVNSQTVPADREITVGFQGKPLIAGGGAMTFGGNAVSELPNHAGVIIGQDKTILLADGEATTLSGSQKDSRQPITISRSGSAFIVNSKTIPANQKVTVGQITASVSASTSASESSDVLYINGTPVPPTDTADGGSSAVSTGVGDYIYSGIGGGAASASSDGSPSASDVDGAVTPFTGDGSRASVWGWSFGGWMLGFFAFLGAVCSL